MFGRHVMGHVSSRREDTYTYPLIFLLVVDLVYVCPIHRPLQSALILRTYLLFVCDLWLCGRARFVWSLGISSHNLLFSLASSVSIAAYSATLGFKGFWRWSDIGVLVTWSAVFSSGFLERLKTDISFTYVLSLWLDFWEPFIIS